MELEHDTLCVCGHELQDHHVSWFRSGYQLIEECEYFGSNETGGAEFVDGKWVDHCMKFRLNQEAQSG